MTYRATVGVRVGGVTNADGGGGFRPVRQLIPARDLIDRR
jgi:hypothetical protein